MHRVSGFDVFYHFYDKTILGSLRTVNKGKDYSLYFLIKFKKFLIERAEIRMTFKNMYSKLLGNEEM